MKRSNVWELRLAFHDGGFVVRYYEEVLPIAPDTYAAILTPGLERWLDDHPGADADELQSILTASRNLPSRSERDPDAIATRAREKEIVKRRLAALAAASAARRGVDRRPACGGSTASPGSRAASTRSTTC